MRPIEACTELLLTYPKLFTLVEPTNVNYKEFVLTGNNYRMDLCQTSNKVDFCLVTLLSENRFVIFTKSLTPNEFKRFIFNQVRKYNEHKQSKEVVNHGN
jgi:hypothetical protein